MKEDIRGIKMDFMKYPKIFAVGHDENKDLLTEPTDKIVLQEKIDGGNFRFMFNDGNIIFGTRTQQMTSSTGEEVNVNKNFKRCLTFVKMTIPPKMIKKYERLIFFGECVIKHSMDYDWDAIPPYLGFDIYDIKTERMLDVDKATSIFKDLHLPFVPIIETLTAKDIIEHGIDEKLIPISAYPPKANPTQRAEGVVFKNYNNGIMAKIVSSSFKEENAKVFGGTPKFEETDTGKIVARFCTNARIEKIVFASIDEGNKLEMKLMNTLPRQVFDDIWEENMKELLKKYSEIRPKDMNRLIAKRCVSVLNQIIINSALNK